MEEVGDQELGCWQPLFREIPCKPFLLGVRSEGSRVLGRVHGPGRAATGNQAASWEEAQRPGTSRTGTGGR